MHSQWGKGMDEKKNDRYNGQFFFIIMNYEWMIN